MRIAPVALVLVALSVAACLPGLRHSDAARPVAWPSGVVAQYDEQSDSTRYTTPRFYVWFDGWEESDAAEMREMILLEATIACPGRAGAPCGAPPASLDVEVYWKDPDSRDTELRLRADGVPLETQYDVSLCGTICGHTHDPYFVDLFRVTLPYADFERAAYAARIDGHVGAVAIAARGNDGWRALADSLQRWSGQAK